MLRPGEALQAAREAPGAREAVSGGVRTEGAFEWRDFMVATYTRAYAERPGFMTLLSDGEWRTGAYALGPEAGEWLQQATVGIGGRVPLSVLFDVIQPFPTFSEAFLSTPSELEAKTTTQGLSTPPITT